jgi:hypothetical protein
MALSPETINNQCSSTIMALSPDTMRWLFLQRPSTISAAAQYIQPNQSTQRRAGRES